MSQETKIRVRNSAVLMKVQASAGTWANPGVNDAMLTEDPVISFDATMIQTNESNPSLDNRAPLPGGMKVGLTLRFTLKGSGSPGVEPEYDPALRVGGMARTVTLTQITGTDISANSGTGKLAAASTDISALTVGTLIYTSGFTNTANNGEFRVAAAGAGDITVTKADGSAHGLTTEAAAASVTISYGVAAVSATAGTSTTFTGASPHSATAGAYQFMPVYLSANPATPAFSHITDYTAGRVGTITETMGSALTSSTKVSIPANVSYTMASDNLPWGSVAVYGDGRLWQIYDLAADSITFTWTPGGTVMAEVSLKGKMYADESDAAVPAAVYDTTRPGIWIASTFSVDRTAIAVNSLSFSVANTLAFPDNPNDSEGFDAPIITERQASVALEPNLSTVATRNTYTKWRRGTPQLVHARVLGGYAANPGQRIMETAPAAIITSRSFNNKNGMRTEQLDNHADGFDAGFGFAIF